MLKNVLPFIFFLFSPLLFSQIELAPGPVLEHDKGIHLYQVIGKSDDAVFSLWLDTRGKNGDDEFYLEKHNLKTLAPEFSVRVYFPEERGMDPVMRDAYLIKDRIVFLTSLKMKKKHILYAQAMNFSGRVVHPYFHLDSIIDGGFDTSFDKEQNTLVVEKTGYDREVRTHAVSVYNPLSFSKIRENEFPSSVIRINADNYYNFGMNQNGLFYYIKRSKDLMADKKAKPEFSFVIAHDQAEKQVIIGEAGENIDGVLAIYVSEENSFIVGGFKEREQKTYSFIYIIDSLGQVKEKKETEVDVKNEKRFVLKMQRVTEKVKFDFYMRNLGYSNGVVWVIGEQNAYQIGSRSSAGGYGVDHFFFYDLIATHFNLGKNTQGWTNFEKREYLKTRTLNGSSTAYIQTKESDLHVLYLDSKQNLEILKKTAHTPDELEKVTEHNNSTLVSGKIDQENKITRKTSTSEFAANLHIKCRMVPDASGPTPYNFLCLQLDDDSMLIFIEDNNVGRWAIIKNMF